MIQTSYFANHRNFPKNKRLISISRFTPKWFKEDYNALELAPSSKLLKDYKDGLVDEAGYDKRYKEETLSKLDPKEIAKKYKDSIFLCYESDDDFCHRQIVADWLRDNGENIEEVVNEIKISIFCDSNDFDYEFFKKIMIRLTSNYNKITLLSSSDEFSKRYSLESNIPLNISILYEDKSYLFNDSDINIIFLKDTSTGLVNNSNNKTYLVNYTSRTITINT